MTPKDHLQKKLKPPKVLLKKNTTTAGETCIAISPVIQGDNRLFVNSKDPNFQGVGVLSEIEKETQKEKLEALQNLFNRIMPGVTWKLCHTAVGKIMLFAQITDENKEKNRIRALQFVEPLSAFSPDLRYSLSTKNENHFFVLFPDFDKVDVKTVTEAVAYTEECSWVYQSYMQDAPNCSVAFPTTQESIEKETKKRAENLVGLQDELVRVAVKGLSLDGNTPRKVKSDIRERMDNIPQSAASGADPLVFLKDFFKKHHIKWIPYSKIKGKPTDYFRLRLKEDLEYACKGNTEDTIFLCGVSKAYTASLLNYAEFCEKLARCSPYPISLGKDADERHYAVIQLDKEPVALSHKARKIYPFIKIEGSKILIDIEILYKMKPTTSACLAELGKCLQLLIPENLPTPSKDENKSGKAKQKMTA